jgi:hypothetical protein
MTPPCAPDKSASSRFIDLEVIESEPPREGSQASSILSAAICYKTFPCRALSFVQFNFQSEPPEANTVSGERQSGTKRRETRFVAHEILVLSRYHPPAAYCTVFGKEQHKS